MKGNTWLVGWLVVTVLLLGGAGFFLAKGYGTYSEEFSGWDNLSSKISRLEKEVPYPSEENEESLTQLVEAYDADVTALYESLDRYQKPLNEQISDSDFTTQILANKVTEFRKAAQEGGMTIKNEDQFYLGMAAYQSTFPRPQIVPILNYQLEATDHLLRLMVESGVDQLGFVNREELPGENSEVEGAEAGVVAGKVVQKYPISVRFTAGHGAFQEFVNRMANDKEYFFILRLLRVENSSPNGPDLGSDEGQSGPQFRDAAGNPPPDDLYGEIQSTTADFSEMVIAFREKGYEMQSADARIIFGQEKVDVFAVVDLVRFLPPAEVEVGGAGAQGKGGKGRR